MKVVYILPLLALAGTAPAVEIVTNGNFEATPPSSAWTQSSASGNLIGDWAGVTGGAVTTNSAFLGGAPSADDLLSQSVIAPIGTMGGTLSFDLTRFTAGVTGFDFLGVSLDGVQLGQFDLGDDAVTDYFESRPTFTLSDSFGAGSHLLKFEVTTNANQGSSAFLDNISLDAKVNLVPEPASLAVLGLGATALLRRRKCCRR